MATPSPASTPVLTLQPRAPATTALLGVFTGGIYCIYWFIATAREMNQAGAQIPSPWFIFVPVVNLWWFWRWCRGAERYTHGYLGAGTALIFLLVVPLSQGLILDGELPMQTQLILCGVLMLLSLACISIPILQSTLNRFHNKHIVAAFE